jgi:anti-sigma regulatory factor (Ser/Thr protein kinase)
MAERAKARPAAARTLTRAAMVARRSHPAGRISGRWLMAAAEMAGLASGRWRPSYDPALAGSCPPRIATRMLGADPRSARAARDFTVAILQRWGMAERSPDIAIVVSELLTNALRHALSGPGDRRPRRPIRLGLLQHGRWVLCAVADPGTGAPAPQTPASLDEAGRGLHIICALSDQWGYTAPTQTGKVVWALFCRRLAPPVLPGPAPEARPRPVQGPGSSMTVPDMAEGTG